MPYGYTGKLLFVDLTEGTMREETPDEATYRMYLGGAGLGAKVLLERMEAHADPLGPGNILGFLTGPLTGTGVYGGGRFTVVAKSPLTGAWADANSGGTWGPELRFAGYDGVFFSGVSPKPIYLVIDQGRAELRNAEALWGKDSYETDDLIQTELGDVGTWKVSCIGPSGEACSLMAGIVNEKGRIAARSGVGAVMGSKRLKAVAVRGKKGSRIPVADREGLRAVQKKYLEEIRASRFHRGLTEAGTGGGTSFLLSIGDCPSKNWNTTGTDSLPDCKNLDGGMMDKYKLEAYGCHTCPIKCGALIRVDEGPYRTEDELHRPEYETVAAFGPLCLVDEIEPIIKVNEICNRAGLDTIGAGGAIAFAMECYENGLLDASDTGGIELTWGSGEALVRLTDMMARREGLGAILADGVEKAAERIGKGAAEYAMHVGGRSLPYHDPRMSPNHGTFYIGDAQPASHMGPQGMSALDAGGALGSDPLLQPPEEVKPFGNYEGKGGMYATGSAYYQLLSSGGLCALYATFYTPPTVELLRPVTGWDLDWSEGLTIGRRILTLRQAFDVREGVGPTRFRFPKRFETPLAVGPGAGQEIPFEMIRERYYEAMGWDPKTGAPLDQTLTDLGLDPGILGS
jgi:aldehyde:ferredoxin oxidoreductase